jgi:hypothetical protein
MTAFTAKSASVSPVKDVLSGNSPMIRFTYRLTSVDWALRAII